MSDEPTGALTPTGEPSPVGDNPDDTALLPRTVETEQRRIDIQKQRAEVALRVVEAADAADKRQYDYGVKQLESNERIAKARLSLAAYIAIGMAVTIVVLFSTVFGILVFGSDQQADRVQGILPWIFAALGGGGLFYAVQCGLRWLIGAG